MQTQDNELSAGEAALRRGIAAARAGLRSVAAAQFERAAEAAPDDANVWFWLAWVGNSPDNTIRCLDRVLQLSPGDAAAQAGLTWARALASDSPAIPVAIPIAMPVANVAENPSVKPVDAVECAVSDSALLSDKSLAVMTELVQEFGAAGLAPTIAAETSSTLLVEPKPDLSANDVAAIVAEVPAEPLAEVTHESPEDLARIDSYCRRWSDLVQSDAVSQTDASAWPSLVPPPLPSQLPPPLPSLIPPPLPAAALVEALSEPEQLASSPDGEPVDQNAAKATSSAAARQSNSPR